MKATLKPGIKFDTDLGTYEIKSINKKTGEHIVCRYFDGEKAETVSMSKDVIGKIREMAREKKRAGESARI